MVLVPKNDAPVGTAALLRAARRWADDRFRQYLRSPRFWLVLAASIVLTAVAGPFDTLVRLTPLTRLLYWTLVLVPTTLFLLYLSMWLREFARQMHRPWGLAALAAGVLGTAPILGLTLTVNAILVDSAEALAPRQVAEFAAPAVIIMTMLLNAFMPTLQPLWGFRRKVAPPPPVAPPGDAPPIQAAPSPFFDRLPPDLGRTVISVRASNHHLEVTTARGQARVLMRLADAEAELGQLPGMRVHRSWWVNLSQVVAADTRAGGLALTLTTGATVPVSRAQRDTVARLLHRPAAQ